MNILNELFRIFSMMGLVFSLITDPINSIIFSPPDTPPTHFDLMNTERSSFTICIKDTEHCLPVLVMKPSSATRPLDTTKYKCIVFSYGNAADLYNMYNYYKKISDLCNVVIVGYDYIGYGLSRRLKPSEQNCYLSLELCMSFVFGLGFTPSQIYLVGHSLGTGVVAEYAAKYKWQNPIILVSPYKSICKVIFDSPIVSCIDKFETIKKVPKIMCPVKIFHGVDDHLIKIKHAKNIYDNLQNKVLTPVWIEGARHHDVLDKITADDYNEVLNLEI